MLPCLLQGSGEPLLVCKGALEEMVELCSTVEDDEEGLLPLDDRSALLAGWVKGRVASWLVSWQGLAGCLLANAGGLCRYSTGRG